MRQESSLNLHMPSQVNVNHSFKWEYHNDTEKQSSYKRYFHCEGKKNHILFLSKTIVKTIPKHKKASHYNQHCFDYLIKKKSSELMLWSFLTLDLR